MLQAQIGRDEEEGGAGPSAPPGGGAGVRSGGIELTPCGSA